MTDPMTSGRMLPSERLDIEVEVLVDDTWWHGWLEHRRHADDRWEGYVRYSTSPGETRLGWFDYGDLRQASEIQTAPQVT